MRGAAGYPRRNRAAPVQAVSRTRDWRELLEAMRRCAEDAERGECDDAANLRRMSAANRINAASPGPFESHGAATLDMAKAFIRAGRAFVRPQTPQDLRREMAHAIADMAQFLDDRLTAMAVTEFQNAHRGRTEIYG